MKTENKGERPSVLKLRGERGDGNGRLWVRWCRNCLDAPLKASERLSVLLAESGHLWSGGFTVDPSLISKREYGQNSSAKEKLKSAQEGTDSV